MFATSTNFFISDFIKLWQKCFNSFSLVGWFILVFSSFLSFFSKFNFCDALIVNTTNAIPFFNKFSEKSKSILVECFLVDGLEDIPNWFFWISTIHSLFSIVMIFLFSLAIRNYFRIK